MTDTFLDRLGDQLISAERTLVAAVPAASRRRRWVTPRTAAAVVAGLAITVPAIAATEPWRPILGRPALHDTPAGTSNTPVPDDARALLGVLRRPQSDLDRSRTARVLLRVVGQQFRGVRVDSVRLLTPSPGHHALVISAQGVGQEPGVAKGIGDPICLIFTAAAVCGDATSLRTHGISVTAGSNVRGLVPDGVATVLLRFTGGQALSADVRDNLFWITTAPTTRHTVPGPPGSGVRRTPPLVDTAPFTAQWLDADDHVIGPPLSK